MSENETNIKEKKGKKAMNRYGVIVVALLAFFVLVVVFVFRIKYVEGGILQRLSEEERIKKDRVIPPKRGNIYAADGRLLATSESLYTIYIDFMAPGVKKDTLDKYINGYVIRDSMKINGKMQYVDSLFIYDKDKIDSIVGRFSPSKNHNLSKYIGALPTALAKKFPQKNARQYQNFFMEGWKLCEKEQAKIKRLSKQLAAPKGKKSNYYCDYLINNWTSDRRKLFVIDTLSTAMSKKSKGRIGKQSYKNLFLYGRKFALEGRIVELDTLAWALAKSRPVSGKTTKDLAKEYRRLFEWELSPKDMDEIIRLEKSGERITTQSRRLKLLDREINYLDLKILRSLPYLDKLSTQNGRIDEEKTDRRRPFGRLAGRTVGAINKNMDGQGVSGVELKYDSILRGEPGVKSRQKVHGKWIDIIEEPAKDGLDVQTTIDVDIQDIVEKALYAKLVETGAELGCAVIMEVETGEIKGISNLDRMPDGSYRENRPYVFSYMAEPGSTFKTASIMIALEDGIVTPQDSFYVGTGLYDYEYLSKHKSAKRTVRDWYWRERRNRGWLTVAEGMYLSSNIVVSKTILKGYEKQQAKYVDKLYALGLTKQIDWDVPLQGIEGTAIIPHPNDKSHYWSAITMPWMSFGYNTQIPPIRILMFYNGIANNGKMLKPFITKAFLKDGKVVESFETEVINSSICSEQTLKQIQDMLLGVTREGTAKVIGRSLSFPAAGKTGTALIASNGRYESGAYLSFCGYFPADKPKYTCFVGIRKPKIGGVAAVVFKNIAEEVYAQNIRLTPSACFADSAIKRIPQVKNGLYDKLATVLTGLGVNFRLSNTGSRWVKAVAHDTDVELTKNNVMEDAVPDVKGMGARDALYLLEKSGLKVELTGAGRVIEQSLTAGTPVVKGAHIKIRLN
ncbi:MAG: PASTA domain-containing protein [Prevotella sp.]|jgi:cell division protein FtsI (penicillin-binding protein 3)|nr:PASTA domain-containing protein [Prevotella sp.]